MPILDIINLGLYELGLTAPLRARPIMLNTSAEFLCFLTVSLGGIVGHRPSPEFISSPNCVPMTLTTENIRRYKTSIALNVVRLAGPAYSANFMSPFFSKSLQAYSYLVALTRFVGDSKV